jgi:hypothetical protein
MYDKNRKLCCIHESGTYSEGLVYLIRYTEFKIAISSKTVEVWSVVTHSPAAPPEAPANPAPTFF